MDPCRFSRQAITAVAAAVTMTLVGIPGAAAATGPHAGPPGSVRELPHRGIGASAEPASAQYHSESVVFGADPAGDATRPVGGANEGCGDIATYSMGYTPENVTAGATTYSLCDPATTPSWTVGDTELDWLFDVNSDQHVDYLVRLTSRGGLQAVIYKVAASGTTTQVCTGTPDSNVFVGYTVSFAPRCIGNPRAFQYATELLYDGDPTHEPGSDVQTKDRAPDGTRYAGPVVRRGYWIVGQDGHVYTLPLLLGDPKHHGQVTDALNLPVVGAAAAPSGLGYWLVASDGGIFAFGDAQFFGSTGAIRLNKPIVGMASTRSGLGYWFVASDGGIFAFGDAQFFGSAASLKLAQPIVGMSSSPTGNGYWFVASDGGVFNYGDATFDGTPGILGLFGKPMVAIVAL